jgi:penicillin-binding protein 2
MIDPVQERRPPITPQLALRVAVLGGMAFVLFAIIFFRLWYLQVLSGDQYLKQARDNRVREVRVQAPRGDILDRSGAPLVDNRPATVVQLDPQSLPAGERTAAATWFGQARARALRPKGRMGPPIPIPPAPAPLQARFERLAATVGMAPATIQERVVRSLGLVPYSSVTIKVDVPETVRNALLERQSEFPGVEVAKRFLRDYPDGELAAQLLGNVAEISDPELKLKRFKGVSAGTEVGKGGIERAYDQYLRGVDGATRITVDALGRPKGQGAARQPVAGRALRTSLDAGVQRTGEKYLAQVINQGTGTAGGFVALDPRTGEVLGMGSYPTFDPKVLTPPVSQGTFDRLFGDTGGAPAFNRAISGQYPTGSTFKPITALTGMSTGLVTPSDTIVDTGCTTVGDNHEKRCNANQEALGSVNLVSALSKSSDVYFYKLGERLNGVPNQPLQRTARRLGLGSPTGIDLAGEFAGVLPDRAWRAQVAERERRCRAKRHISLGASGVAAAAAGCGYSDMRPWTVGDEVNLAIGQGDLQATPLQMAVAYAALANGGAVVRPHLGVAVEDADGRVLQRIEPGASRHVRFDPVALQAVRDGLHDATLSGTSADVFKGWPQDQYPVYGKTGTATRDARPQDQSWYVCYVPDPKRPIVVAVTVEDGGWGAVAAAPVARTILSQWFNQPIKFVAGSSHTL